MTAPLAAIVGTPFTVEVVVPSDGPSSLVIRAVPAGQIDLAAVVLPDKSLVTDWACESSGPKISCTGTGPMDLWVLPTVRSKGAAAAGAATGKTDSAGTISLELTAPDGAVTSTEVSLIAAVDPSPTTTSTTTETTTTEPTSTPETTKTETTTESTVSTSTSPFMEIPVVVVTSTATRTMSLVEPSILESPTTFVFVTVSPSGAVIVTSPTKSVG